ncbi:hypothetical protein LGH70_06330 [Hymenobacter sp. BT635]|uniref:Outer membrane lipoprotein carrier protein LolA n=1 Tax=Hymenobacter nitidus TaxID=2880929 RepID=A0ABS8AA87_9BACT|nr:hypothetical protein [Hymenobacter nitidus]MCB2377191.1 hypothetical protein [Hymenobacter nitidus]
MIKYGLLGSLLVSGSLTAAGQQVLQGDSVYQNLQTNKSSLADIKRVMGWPSSKKKLVNIKYGHFREGGSFTSKSLVGYTFSYKRRGVNFTVEEETHKLSRIAFRPAAAIVTAKGIQPGKSTFADVVAAYGAIDVNKDLREPPYIYQARIDRHTKKERWITVLRYQGIRFVSYGKLEPKVDFSPRRVDEIQLD